MLFDASHSHRSSKYTRKWQHRFTPKHWQGLVPKTHYHAGRPRRSPSQRGPKQYVVKSATGATTLHRLQEPVTGSSSSKRFDDLALSPSRGSQLPGSKMELKHFLSQTAAITKSEELFRAITNRTTGSLTAHSSACASSSARCRRCPPSPFSTRVPWTEIAHKSTFEIVPTQAKARNLAAAAARRCDGENKLADAEEVGGDGGGVSVTSAA